jgi:lysylphosphatidylglycerol synthase-like protein
MTARSRRLFAVLGAVIGSILFAYALRRAGTADILDGIRRVGWGLLLIFALGGVRFVVRAACWRLCVPRFTGLSFRGAWSAFLAGDAVGNVTPLGLLASEPTKVFLTRHDLATRESVSSLALENLVYAASVMTMIGVGIGVLLIEIDVASLWRWIGVGALASLAIAAVVVNRLLRGTWDEARGARPRWRETLASVRMAIVGFSAEYRARLWQVFALELGFHALAVLEIYITLQWLVGGGGVTIAQAIVFETLNRVVTVAFKFVPFRIGVDEALSGALAPVLAVDPAAGVTLAVVRKIRNLFWSGVGLTIIVAHPARRPQKDPRRASDPVPAAPATDPHENVSAHRP